MIHLYLILSLLFSQVAVMSPFIVEGPSMLPTMSEGDVFFLNGAAYANATPQRGDVVVFVDDRDTDYLYVKRVVGLPGERIHVTTTGIYLETDGRRKEILEPYVAHAEENGNFASAGYKDELFVVPRDKYFVLGDNRSHSLDSRTFLHPFIPIANIRGKYIFTLLKT